jgi:hypothetical protein
MVMSSRFKKMWPQESSRSQQQKGIAMSVSVLKDRCFPANRHNKTDGRAAVHATRLRYVFSAGKQVHPSNSSLRNKFILASFGEKRKHVV